MTNEIYIPTFSGDRLTIYDEMHVDSQPTKTILCGSNPPPQMISRSNKLLLNFHSDDDKGDAGYRIKVERGK